MLKVHNGVESDMMYTHQGVKYNDVLDCQNSMMDFLNERGLTVPRPIEALPREKTEQELWNPPPFEREEPIYKVSVRLLMLYCFAFLDRTPHACVIWSLMYIGGIQNVLSRRAGARRRRAQDSS